VIAVVVITHNRVEILRQCVENVLLGTTPSTTEIVVWDNASTDGTHDYLQSLDDPRITPVFSPENVGMNGYARGFARTSAPYLVEMDDDVVGAPSGWDAMLLDAFRRLPDCGFLAADLTDDPRDRASFVRWHQRPHEYTLVERNGVRLLDGPAGGACAMTSRELSDRVGGFRERPGEIFWLEDERYIQDIQTVGFRAWVLADLQVEHRGGPHYAPDLPEKLVYWQRYNRRMQRRNAVKRVLLAIPFFARLNARYAWFQPPTPLATPGTKGDGVSV
jgi:GT2 family glycosyltransferase